MKLNTREVSTIINALNVAAERYEADEKAVAAAGMASLAAQFNTQRQDAYQLAARLEMEEL